LTFEKNLHRPEMLIFSLDLIDSMLKYTQHQLRVYFTPLLIYF